MLRKILTNKYVIGFLVIVLLIVGGYIFINKENIQKGFKHSISSAVGLNRTVEVLNYEGKAIREWKGRFKIEPFGAGISFIDENGKEVKIMGQCIVQEVD